MKTRTFVVDSGNTIASFVWPEVKATRDRIAPLIENLSEATQEFVERFLKDCSEFSGFMAPGFGVGTVWFGIYNEFVEEEQELVTVEEAITLFERILETTCSDPDSLAVAQALDAAKTLFAVDALINKSTG